MSTNIATRWKELHGQDNWKNLLDPLDVDLRQNVIIYGELAQATYDAFNQHTLSVYAGASRYSKVDFFSKVGLVKRNPYKYRVTKFIYATAGISLPFFVRSKASKPWCTQSNWIGFVAVATDEGKVALGRRDIVVAWRGTIEALEWVNDLGFILVSAAKIIGGHGGLLGLNDPMVHQGWMSIYTSVSPESAYNKTSARDQVLAEVKRLLEEFKDEELSITITGHSLGAALGTLNATDIVANGLNKINDQIVPVTGFVFASPRVGNFNFKRVFNSLPNLRVLRLHNTLDIVPNYPLPILYDDVGKELYVNTLHSPHMKTLGTPLIWHNLEAYMHMVAGMQPKGRFKFEIERDIALVNKFMSDGLKDEYLIPGSWLHAKDKGMVQEEDGRWTLKDHEEDDQDVEIEA